MKILHKSNLLTKSKYSLINNNSFLFTNKKEIPTVPKSDEKFGNLLDVGKAGGHHYFLAQKHKELGPVLYYWIYDKKCVSLGHPKYWQAMSHLSTKTNYIRLFMKGLFGSFKAVALANSEDRDRRYAQFITPFINQQTVEAKHYLIMDKYLDYIVKDFGKYVNDGKSIPIIERFSVLMVRSMVELLWGRKNLPEEDCIKIYQYLSYSIINVELESFQVIEDPKKQAEVKHKIDWIHNFIRDGVKERLSSNKTDLVCFTDYLREENDFEIISADVTAFFFASIHNPISLMFATVYHIANNPDKQAILQEEIEKNLKGKEVNNATIKSLRYMRLCINEAMRATPPVATSSRVDFENDIQLPDGYIIPKNTTIVTPLGLVSQNSEVYENVDKFIPERFKNGFKWPNQLAPFGFAGGRVCAGKNIAMHFSQLVLASLFKNYTFSPSKKQGSLNLYFGTGTVSLDEVYVDGKLKH